MGKIKEFMKIDFESRPVYGDDDGKYIKTKNQNICWWCNHKFS